MRVTTAFNKMLDLPGASVAMVTFSAEGLVLQLRRRGPHGHRRPVLRGRAHPDLRGTETLDGAARVITRNYLERCVTDAITSGDPLIYDELMKVLDRRR